SPTALLRYRHAPLRDRLAIMRALLRWSQTPHAETFADELRARGQSDRAIERFWDVFIRPALNLPAEEASAEAGLFTVKAALLFDRQLLREPLAALLGSPAHWVFNRGLLTGSDPRYVTVVSSGAPELEALRGRELVDLIAGAVTERLGAAELLWSRVSREPRA